MPENEFGNALRRRRNAIGMSLREFCRITKLHAGNVSRIERGQAKPPQASQILELIATTLGLKPESDQWRELFDLAAVENGRLPADTRDNRPQAAKIIRAFRSRTYPCMVRAIDLEGWAKSRDAQGQLPRLVRRLVRESTVVERAEFPADEGIQRSGWDGIVSVANENETEFVPAGVSVWELGVKLTSSAKSAKAFKDFTKRSGDPLGQNPKETTLVLATPSHFPKKHAFREELRSFGIWRDVRIYDSASLEEWLECAPATDIWFAELLGLRPNGVTDVDVYWRDLSTIAQRPLLPGVFLASRDAELKWLDAWLKGLPTSLAVQARSPTEVVDFFVAYAVSMIDSEKDEVASRALIVETEDAWRLLAGSTGRLILIPHPRLILENEMIARAVGNGHHVLHAAHRFSNARIRNETLPRSNRHLLQEALVESGFPEQEADRFARESGGSLTILKRRIAKHSSSSTPAWSHGAEGQLLAPLILAGAWQEHCDADKRFLERIAGVTYPDILRVADRWTHADDAPLMQIQSRRSFISREDSWELLGRYLTTGQLEAFEVAAVQVLSEPDPKLDLPAEDRPLANLLGKKRLYSPELRKGIAESLGLLASLPLGDRDESSRAARIVRALLPAGMNWQNWASLSDELTLLAEAAPKVFLEAISIDLDSSAPQVPQLFKDGSAQPLFSSCQHAGLLWAIETVAWSREYFADAILLLARLHETDTGGQWANRPISSLIDILLPWFPQTTVSVSGRVKVLRQLATKFPDVGWKALLRLLPSHVGHSSPTHHPAWRNWRMDWSPGASNAEYWQQTEACAAQLVEMVDSDTDRWVEIIERLESIPAASQEVLLSKLSSLHRQGLPEMQRAKLTEVIREKVQRHRRFADKDWSLSPQAIDQLVLAEKSLEPSDVVARHAWLFSQRPALCDIAAGESYDDMMSRLLNARRSSIQDIIDYGGLDAIRALVSVCETPYDVGVQLAKVAGDRFDRSILPGCLCSPDKDSLDFGRGYFLARFDSDGWRLFQSLGVDEWSDDQATAAALAMPLRKKTWEWVSSRNEIVVERFWKNCSVWWQDVKDERPYVVSQLVKFGRPFSAIHMLATCLIRKQPVGQELILTTLEACTTANELSEAPANDLRYELQQLFLLLQASPDCEQQRLAMLEWQFLGVLDGHGASPKALHSLIESNAEFFVSVLRLVFRSEFETKDETATRTEAESSRSQQAYKLLSHWETVPGTSEDGKTVDLEHLRAWVAAARKFAKESGHLGVCDAQIGEVFAYSPTEPDGGFPCLAVRHVITESNSDELLRGFARGVLNSRGMHGKSPFAGGEAERSLAAKYAGFAKSCSDEWPRVAEALNMVSRDYKEQADEEDARAEARK